MCRKPMDSSAGTEALHMAAMASDPRNKGPQRLSVLSWTFENWIIAAKICYMDFLQKVHVTDLVLMASP